MLPRRELQLLRDQIQNAVRSRQYGKVPCELLIRNYVLYRSFTFFLFIAWLSTFILFNLFFKGCPSFL